MDVAASVVSDVVLRDGSTMRFRPPLEGDAVALLEFFQALSDRSLFLRFHGHPSVDERLVEPVLEPNWDERGALVGTKDDEIVALASYVRLRAAGSAEVAFAVADEFQGRGIATRLLERLAPLAASVGIDEFVAEVMPDNIEDAESLCRRRLRGDSHAGSGNRGSPAAIRVDESLRTRMDERDHVAVAASLQPFFRPAAVAVVGASSRTGSIGGELFRNVLRAEFAGVAYPVNRSGESVAGVRSYRNISEIGEAVDLALICLPGSAVLEAAEEALPRAYALSA